MSSCVFWCEFIDYATFLALLCDQGGGRGEGKCPTKRKIG